MPVSVTLNERVLKSNETLSTTTNFTQPIKRFGNATPEFGLLLAGWAGQIDYLFAVLVSRAWSGSLDISVTRGTVNITGDVLLYKNSDIDARKLFQNELARIIRYCNLLMDCPDSCRFSFGVRKQGEVKRSQKPPSSQVH